MQIFDDNGQVSLEKINDVEKLLNHSSTIDTASAVEATYPIRWRRNPPSH